MQKILEEIASSIQYDATKFLADFKNGDEWISEEEMAEKIQSVLAEKFKAAKDAARKQGRKEVTDKVSRIVKNSGFDNPDGLEGDALFSAFIEWKGEQSAHIEGDPRKMSREELLKVPAVQAIVKEVKSKEAEHFAVEKGEWEKKVRAAENTRKSLLLDKTLLQVLEKGKINLGETPETKAVRLGFLKSGINLDRVEIGDDGNLKFLDNDGYETDFEKEFLPVAQTAFGVVTQDKNRGGSGAQGSGSGGNGAGGTKVTIAAGTTIQELDKMVMAAKPEDREPIKRAWLEQQKAAGN